jgi:WD40 repeat protein/predicted Ser/Thr protein kinase
MTMPMPARCPQCGADGVLNAVEGLCSHCLLSLALLESPRSHDGPDAPTHIGAVAGRLFADRYQIRELLGRGGMGEVYLAFDLKLRVDVALKAVRPGHAGGDRARDLLRREVRAAREVLSPNVCRIFDLIDKDGEELLSMEYIDGTTLGETMRARGPLRLAEARDIAAQFLAGLEAIHRVGLVHRDFKPENVMITRAGRVVVMDFGVARAARDEPVMTIAGTPAYMAPEQARGEDVDARADVFSAGVVLAEMITAGGRDGMAARETLWRRVRQAPPAVPEGPWSAVLLRALASSPDHRYRSAHALARALEEVTLRVPGVEERRPYPGLAAFTEQDAEYFFGREVEVEAIWKKLKRPRLLGVIGPSGAGKSSFLRAGVLPTLPPSWKSVLATPGTQPFQALAQALVPMCAGDTAGLQSLVRFDDADGTVAAVARWRARHEHTLVIVDQFEELFTQNAPLVQASFAQLLARLVLDADTHVILSLRDDFLIHCHPHGALTPMLSDLTLLGPLGPSALRRALVQPALSCGYQFEDDALVQEMVDEVVSERGALPLLAFAASRVWDARDREKGVLTRAAYHEIGGVAGALAQHAESTLERIGAERIPLVRELFRNLVTSQGTRAVRGRDDLLSVFAREAGERVTRAAEAVLNTLVDARLLTTYERTGDAGERLQQIEIIHESLLTAWPRLVRWQTQDADGAQLRDQLRQAAQLWHDRGRPEDLLWSGVAYRDFALWRERYPGGLTAMEEAFAEAARRRTGRRRRTRQLAVITLLAAVAIVAVTMAVLWRRSEIARQHATAESLRAEAGKLQLIGERELPRNPTAALAYIVKSLELADTESARLLALRLVQEHPVARIARASESAEGGVGEAASGVALHPAGEWAAWGGHQLVQLLDRRGQRRLRLDGYSPRGAGDIDVCFTHDGTFLVANRHGEVRVWAVPGGHEVFRDRVEDGRSFTLMSDKRFYTLTLLGARATVHDWPLPPGSPRAMGAVESHGLSAAVPGGLIYAVGRDVYLRSFASWAVPARRIFEQPTEVTAVSLSRDAAQIATGDADGTIRVGSAARDSGAAATVLTTVPGVAQLDFDPSARWLFAFSADDGLRTIRLFDRSVASGIAPLVLQRRDATFSGDYDFDSTGRWLITAHGTEAAFWPLTMPRGRVVRAPAAAQVVLFAPDGRRLVALADDQTVRTVPLVPGEEPRTLYTSRETPLLSKMAVDPSGRRLAVSGYGGRLILVRSDGASAEKLEGFSFQSLIGRPAFSRDGRLLAAGVHGVRYEDPKTIRVWNLERGTSRSYGSLPGAGPAMQGGIADVVFAGPDRLLAAVRYAGLISLDLESGVARVVVPRPIDQFALGPDGTWGVAIERDRFHPQAGPGRAVRFDLVRGSTENLEHGDGVIAIALDAGGALVATISVDRTVRVSPVSGGPPHLLLGAEGAISSIAFSPDSRWLAASGEALAIRLWPVPDVSKPPPHLLTRDAMLTWLRSHTNLRAVPNAASSTGYVLEPGPFPGWAEVPSW